MSRFLSTMLAHIDIFRFPLSLKMNKKEKTSTTIGKIMTILIFTFIISSILVSDMFNKRNPNALTQNLQISPRPSITFSKNNFTLAVGVIDNNNAFYVDETIFSLVLIRYSQDAYNLSTTTRTEFALNPCRKEDYKEDPTEFDRLSLNGSYCTDDEPLKLNGFWDEDRIEYFWIELRTCLNTTNNTIVCKSKEEISKFFENRFFEVILTDHNIDATNYLNPSTRSVKMYIQRLERTLTKTMSLYLQRSLIYTGDGYLYSPQKQPSVSYSLGKTETDFSFNKYDTDNIIYVFNIYSSNLQIVVTREYQKFDSVLAQIGGMCNFLLFLGLLISYIENHHKLITFLGNELYIFPNIEIKRKDFINFSESRKGSINKNEKPDINRDIKIIEPIVTNPQNVLYEVRNSKKNISSLNLIPDSGGPFSKKKIDRNESELKNLFSPKYSYSDSKTPREIRLFRDSDKVTLPEQVDENRQGELRQTFRIHEEILDNVENNNKKLTLEHYQNLKKKENKIIFGFSNWIKLISKGIFNSLTNFNMKELLYKKVEQKIAEELDIVQILKKLHDVEKLKRILLTEEQLFFFDLVSKPMVTLNEDSLNESTDKKFRFSLAKSDFRIDKVKLWDMYKLLKERKSFVDRRIIHLLDEDVTSFLQNEKIEE